MLGCQSGRPVRVTGLDLATMMFRWDGPESAAGVGWEMSTIGDPLLDLGRQIAEAAELTGEGMRVFANEATTTSPFQIFRSARDAEKFSAGGDSAASLIQE